MKRLCFLLMSVSLTCFTGCLERYSNDGSAPGNECTPCHGGSLEPPLEAAPPFNLSGEESPESRGNGAHKIHLKGTARSRALQCNECHIVPQSLYEPGHVDTPYPAEVTFSGPAKAFKAEPVYDAQSGSCQNTFCHGDSFVGFRPSGGTLTQPSWTALDGSAGQCDACHSLPPPLPHPNQSECSDCHKNIDTSLQFTRPELHVDGVVTFFLPSTP